MKYLSLYILVFILVGCGTRNKSIVSDTDAVKPIYAKGFAVTSSEGFRIVDVYNPWDSLGVLQRYVLVDKDATLPDSLPEGTLIRTPVSKVAVSSSIDVATLEQLGMLDIVTGCFDVEYLTKSSHCDRLSKGYIKDLGSARKTTVEPIILLKPELIFAAPFKGETHGVLTKAGIPIAEVAAYLEVTPLGRCEWIKFYAEFTNKRSVADSLFTAVETRYNDIKEQIKRGSDAPKLLVEKRFGQVWYVPAGGSYAANLYRDAGADYPWADSKGTGSLSLSFEEVFMQTHDADIWIFRYFDMDRDMTYNMLLDEYPQYSSFEPFKKKNIYICNTAKTDYFGTISLQPDAELRDLAKIFYPHLYPDVPFVYYGKLND